MTNQVQPTATTGTGGSKRIVGMTGQGAGIVGIVISLLLIVGLVFARSWALDTVNGISTRVDDGLAKGIPLIDTASTKVDEVSGTVSTVADSAAALAEVATPATGVIAKFNDAISSLSEKYLALRSSYADARGRITGAMEGLNTIDRLLPGFSVPEGPVDALTDLDARIQELDATVMELIAMDTGDGAIGTIATKVAERAATLEARLATLSTGLATARTKLDTVRTEIASTTDTAETAINLLSVLMILGCIYLVALHVVLYRSAKAMTRAPAS